MRLYTSMGMIKNAVLSGLEWKGTKEKNPSVKKNQGLYILETINKKIL